MANENRCPNCGAERSGNAPEGLCPRCLMLNALREATSVLAGNTAAGLPQIEPDTTRAETAGPIKTTEGHGSAGNLPRGATVRYFGDYEIQNELGRGGMGVVYKARQVSLNRPVALKMIKAGVLADDTDLRRFQNEAEAVALLDHAGIVPVHEVGEHAGQRYFSMKLIEGCNLAERLASFSDNPRAAATLLIEMAEAVHHAHMRGILHRDLKPANILIDADGHTHITDFGLAKRIVGDVEMTASGAIMGTPAYMSPEQASGRRGSITTATDVYGLGAIFYALLTGRAPFGGDSVIETLDAVRSRPPESPTKLNVRIPRDLETICLKCLEKDPRRRYPSAQALADDLQAWLGSQPISARRVGAVERAWLWCKRKPAIAALAAAVLLTVVGGTAAVISVQAKANAGLRAANVRERQRFDLAMDAIKLFHGEVSEDLLMKEKQFDGLRTKLLKGAAEFYGRLEDLLKGQTDRESRAALGKAYDELGELTGKIGDQSAALAVHQKALAVRRALASEPGANAERKLDVARSLDAAGWLQRSTGDMAGALASFDEARRLAEEAETQEGAADKAHEVQGKALHRIAYVLTETGDTTGALATYRKALAIRQKLADANPANLDFQRDLAASYINVSDSLRKEHRPAEAREGYDRALAIGEPLARKDATNTLYQSSPGFSLRGRGQTRLELGDLAGASADTRRALRIWDGLPTRTGEHWFETACCHSTLAALAGRERSGVSAGEAGAEADKAMATLNKAVSMGYREFARYKDETALDGLRDRVDFRLLMMDLAVPDWPLAPSAARRPLSRQVSRRRTATKSATSSPLAGLSRR